MHTTQNIALHERGVLLRHGLPLRALGPGRHSIWGYGRTVMVLDTRKLVVDLPDEVRAVFAEGTFGEARLAAHERGVLFRQGRPQVFLGPGFHRFWALDPSVELHVFDTGEPVPDVTDELLALLPKTEIVQATVLEFQRALLYVKGRFERVLEPGRYAFWTRAGAPVAVRLIDMRRQQLTIPAQELLTRDKVSLRLSVAVDHAPADPHTAPHTVADPDAALYTLVQLALREHVAAVTLDELLEGRDALTAYLETRTSAEALRFGVRVLQVGVKDIILPGDMKALMNRVIEAEKQAVANVILRREEAAATRTLANAAKVMADNPVLLRLKELEAVERIAAQVGEVKLSLGPDGVDGLRQLLTRGN
ncbi:MAG: slipin family protein [Sandaracinaceae bacterium]|nr:slipin family protein [Sandaracinaceae bacterium]